MEVIHLDSRYILDGIEHKDKPIACLLCVLFRIFPLLFKRLKTFNFLEKIENMRVTPILLPVQYIKIQKIRTLPNSESAKASF